MRPPLRYYAAQLCQAWAKRAKPPHPFMDVIVASTQLPHDARILCLGARNRLEPEEWERRGYQRVVAVDLLPSRGVRMADIHRLPLPDAAYDLVYGSHVFEHSWDADRAVGEACRVVRPGGLLFAAFPVGCPLTAHDRVDFGDEEGFCAHLTRPWRPLWSSRKGTEVALLVALA